MNITTVGICGCGTMGRGIAIASVLSGKSVVMYDVDHAFATSALTTIGSQLSKMVEKNKLTEADRITAMSRLVATDVLGGLQHCEVVVEAIVEKLEPKQQLFVELENIVTDDAILATNTSSISVASISRVLKIRKRFLGLHFFNPANIMKLVEVIRGPHTSGDVVETALTFATQLGKTPVVAKDVPGFIVNRVARNFYNEAQRIVMEGAASIDQVDDLIKGLGFKMGPFELMDLIGVDTNLDVTKSQWQQFFLEPRFQPSLMQQQYVDAGRLGLKSDGGFKSSE